jgi:hypothetical protein
VAAHNAPHQSEQQQTQNGIAAAKMPDHGVAADIASDDQTQNEYGE